MAKTATVLIAEHDPETAESVRTRLDVDAFTSAAAATAQDALRRIAASVPDVLLLDTALPGLSTREMCQLLRSRTRTAHLPVILLGQRDGGVGLVDGLGLGADDYVFKPLDPNEVAARVRAVLRRRGPHEDDRLARYEGAHISADFERVAVSVDGVSVSLTLREFKLLRALLGSRNQVMSRATLLAEAWGTDGWDARVVDSAMWKLRAKLGDAARQIETVTGFGYRFSEPDRQPAQANRRT